MENLLRILKIFNDTTFAISTATVTVSEVIPIVNSIKKLYQTRTFIIGIIQIYVDIVNSIHKRFKHLETEPNYCLVTLLDIRLKSSVFLNQEDLKIATQLLISEIDGLESTNENIHGMIANSQVKYCHRF